MIDYFLNDLKNAINLKDTKKSIKIIKYLNKVKIDNYTIYVLLSDNVNDPKYLKLLLMNM